MNRKITKAVIPVAGLGTRVMPLTLHQPKGMVSIVDRPLIHYIIDEAISAGIEHIILIVGPNQPQFKQYLDFLKKDPEWKNIKFDIATQAEALGDGHVFLMANKLIGDEPFLGYFSDDIMIPLGTERSPVKKMLDLFSRVNAPIIALEAVPKNQVSRYGVVDAVKTEIDPELYRILNIVQKPSTEDAPSNLTFVGRFIITPDIMQNLKKIFEEKKISVRGEYELVDGFNERIKKGGDFYGWKFPNIRLDCGSKLGIVKAQAYFAANHKEFREEFRKYLKTLSS